MIGRQSQLRGRDRLRGLRTETRAAAEELTHERRRFEALDDRAPVVVQAHQLFPTPPELARRVVRLARIEGGRVLEPSAGTGNLLREMTEAASELVAVEISAPLAHILRRGFPACEVTCGDFLACGDELGRFDRIVMNPPFTRGSDVRHIEHARRLLAPGGRLVSLCAAGPKQRAALMPAATEWIDLPAGSFRESGTGVAAAIVVFDNN